MNSETLNEKAMNYAFNLGKHAERIESFNRDLEKDLEGYKENRLRWNRQLEGLKRTQPRLAEMLEN
jgi:hypothetical protein